MFLFKQKQTLKTVAQGKVIPLEAVPDAVFSAKMMGEGFAITGHSGAVYAPVTGKVVNIFPTKHAITLKSETGTMILVHMGLDTVELKGLPFDVAVVEGQAVTPATLLATIDLTALQAAQKDATIVVVMPDIKQGKMTKTNCAVALQETVFKF